jgi:hypothetical protein
LGKDPTGQHGANGRSALAREQERGERREESKRIRRWV